MSNNTEEQVINLDITGGVDTKQDQKLQLPAKLNILENGLFDDAPTPVRRFGLTKPTISGDLSTNAVVGMTTFKNRVLAETPTAGLMQHVSGTTAATRFKQVGTQPGGNWPWYRVGVEIDPATTRQGLRVGRTLPGGYYDTYCNGSERATATDAYDFVSHYIKLSIQDEETKATLFSTYISTGGENKAIKVLPSDGSRYAALFQQGDAIYALRFSTSDGFIGTTTVYTSADTITGWDARVDSNNNLWLAVMNEDGIVRSLELQSFYPGWGGVQSSYVFPDEDPTGLDPCPVHISFGFTGGNYTADVFYTALVGGTDYGLFVGPTHYLTSVPTSLIPGTTTQLISPYDNTTGASPQIPRRMTSVYDGSNTRLFVECFAAETFDITDSTQAGMGSASVDYWTYNVGTPGVSYNFSIYNQALHSNPVIDGSGRVLLFTSFLSATQPGIYGWDVSNFYGDNRAHSLCRLAPGEAGGIAYQYTAAQPVLMSSYDSTTESVWVPFPKWAPDLQLANGQNVTPEILMTAKISLSKVTDGELLLQKQLGDVEAADVLLLGGGTPSIFDGDRIDEFGPNIAPEFFGLTTGPTAGSPGTVSPLSGAAAWGEGTFLFTCTESIEDAAGNTHEGPPALPVSMTTTSTHQGLPFLTGYLMAANSIIYHGFGNGRLNWYRTTNGGTTFYRMFAANTSTLLNDTQLLASTPLYTNGGILPNDIVSGFRVGCVFQNRAWLVDNDGRTLKFSKELFKGFAPEFPSTFRRFAPGNFGRIVGVRTQGPVLYVFGENKVGIIRGEGPDDSGAGDNYSQIETVFEGYGADWDSPLAIEESATGIWFKSKHGVRCFADQAPVQNERGLDLGSEMDTLMSGAIVAIKHPTKQSVWFYQADKCLVYDELWKQWSTMTNNSETWGSVAAAAGSDVIFHSNTTADLYVYDESHLKYWDDHATDTEDDRNFYMRLQTSHLAVAGTQGFQRVKDFMLLAYQKHPETDGRQETYIANALDFSNSNTIIGTAVTPAAAMHQMQINLPVQKCEAIRLDITTRPYFGDSPPTNRGVRIASIALKVEVKGGMVKLPSSTRHSTGG